MKYPQGGVNLYEKQDLLVEVSTSKQRKKEVKLLFKYQSDGSLMAWMHEESIPNTLSLKIS